MEKKLVVGIVGAGLTAHLRYYAIKEFPGNRIRVKGVYSRTPGNLAKFSKEISVKAFNSLEEMYKDAEINTISLNIPNRYHYEFVKSALYNGKNVIVEYPLVINDYKEAEELLEFASERGLFLHVGQTMKYDNDLKFLIKNKDHIGEILTGYKYISNKELASSFNFSGSEVNYNGLGKWYVNDNESGGWIITAHYHYIQIFRKILGEVISIFAVDSSRNNIAMSTVIMKHENDSSSVIQWGFPIPGRNFALAILTGTIGSIRIINNEYLIYSNKGNKEGVFTDDLTREINSFVEDWKFLLDKLDGRENLDEDNSDMLKSLKVAMCAQKSAIEGKTVLIK